LVEQLIRNQQVVSSSLTGSTSLSAGFGVLAGIFCKPVSTLLQIPF
jgi:hypothetical protein